MSDGAITLDRPEQIHMFHLLQIKHAMRLEQLGMTHSSGRSAHALAKKILGIKGSKEKVYAEFCKYIHDVQKGNPAQQG